jgi:diacylglycerol kinase
MTKPYFKNQTWYHSFINAVSGLKFAFQTQRNFKIHLVISSAVLLLVAWLRLDWLRSIIILMAIFLGLTIELANTAFEKTVDLITKEYNPDAKIVKDVSAGMMLLISLGLGLLGTLILLPPLLAKIFF